MKNTSPTWNAAVRALWLGLALVLLAAGCASVDPVVKIGLVAPFEGRQRAVGYDAIYSARLAVRQINAAGGVGGHRVALVALDDRGYPALAADAAASLGIDPGVVAVVGHYLPETTAAAAPLYAEDGLALLPLGEPPFDPFDPTGLPPDFLAAYAEVTPFDETAGPYAGPTYDAFGLLSLALAQAEQSGGAITRATVQEALRGLEYEGMTGAVYWP
jgi:ABC-type branched-subunit amino acid transport system substrate-binding protein